MTRILLQWACVFPLLLNAAVAQETPAQGAPIRVECHGQLRDGVVAIGGETTGTTLRFLGITWELQFPDREGQTFAQTHDKQPVTVSGTLRRVAGLARPARWIVDVERYAPRDPAQRKEGATTTLSGTLIRDPAQPAQWFVDNGKTACPVQLPADAAFRPGQTVTVEGALEKREQPPADQPPFLIRATKAAPLNRPPT